MSSTTIQLFRKSEKNKKRKLNKMKKIFRGLVVLLVSIMLSVQARPQSNDSNNTSGTAWIKNIPADDLIKWRRHIHENAEVSFKEENTSRYVDSILKSIGNITIIKPAKTSVIGILKGSKTGKSVAFRADMDALSVQEETGLTFASKNKNVSHACGHDAHTADSVITTK